MPLGNCLKKWTWSKMSQFLDIRKIIIIFWLSSSSLTDVHLQTKMQITKIIIIAHSRAWILMSQIFEVCLGSLSRLKSSVNGVHCNQLSSSKSFTDTFLLKCKFLSHVHKRFPAVQLTLNIDGVVPSFWYMQPYLLSLDQK